MIPDLKQSQVLRAITEGNGGCVFICKKHLRDLQRITDVCEVLIDLNIVIEKYLGE